MIGILLWSLGFILILGLDLPRMWKKKHIREIMLFSGILTMGLVYGILFQMEISLPDPNALERMIFEPIGKQLMK